MISCPRCQYANPEHTTACGRCGGALPRVAAELAAPLPDRMTEPVFAPVPDAPNAEPLPPRSSIALSFAGTETDSDADVAPPAPSTRWVGPRHKKSTDGVSLARTEPDLLMNESVAQTVNATIPATDPADQPPTPPPPPSLRPKLVVLRGMKISAEYPIYEGRNTIGRFADKPVDIDLVSQESNEQIWCSRQHAIVAFDKDNVLIEDMNSLNGTWVNGVRIHAGQPKVLRPGDVVQVGTVQMKLVLG